MKKTILFLTLFAALASCAEEKPEENNPEQPSNTETAQVAQDASSDLDENASDQPKDASAETTAVAEDASTQSQDTQTAVNDQQEALYQNTQQFNDWSVNCLYKVDPVKQGEKPKKGILRDCQSTQIFSTQDNQQIMRLYMLYEQVDGKFSEQPSLYFHIPLRAFLQPQIAIQIDQNKAIIVPFNFCDQGGCYAGGQIDQTILKQMQKGSKTKIVFFNHERQPIALDLSLSGYTKAINNLYENTKNVAKEVLIPQS